MSIVNISFTLDAEPWIVSGTETSVKNAGVDLVVVSVETNFEIITDRKNCHLRLLYGDSKNWH